MVGKNMRIIDKREAEAFIKSNLMAGDLLIGIFLAQSEFKKWLVFVLGPFALLTVKYYIVAVTERGINFYRLNRLKSTFIGNYFITFGEIENVKIGKGVLAKTMSFKFKNGKEMRIRAQVKGIERVAALTDTVEEYIVKNIPTR
jgi:hypothetical protein